MSTKKSVLVATPSWNRRPIISLLAASLQASDLRLEDTEYIISDDASTEYSEEDLKTMFPWADVVRHRQKHGHPLMNTHYCFDEFIRGAYDTLVILDSDMIVSRDWRSRLDELVSTPGFTIGSLYNSASHRSTEDHGSYLLKASAGFAGMVFSRASLLNIKAHLQGHFDDWKVCRHVGTTFRVTKPSAIAHIGIDGQWNGGNYALIDKAVDFDWGSSVNPDIKAACEALLRVSL
jgi:hypothetical protein